MNEPEGSVRRPSAHDPLERLFDAMHRINRLFASVTEPNELLSSIVQVSEQTVEAGSSALLLYDAEREDLYFHVAHGIEGDQERLKREVRLPLGEGIAGRAVQSRNSINVADAQHDERFYPLPDRITGIVTHSVIAVPMVGHNELVGVIEVINKRDGRPFTEVDVKELEMFAQQAALAIENARLIEANIQAERLAAAGRTVQSLAHYAKNILAGLSASCQLIGSAVTDGEYETIEQGWHIHKHAVGRLSALVSDMLAFGRVPRGAPLRRPCSLADIIGEIVDEHRPLFVQKCIEVSMDIEVVPQAFVDRDAVRHVLVNIIHNAIEAVPERAGRVTVALAGTESTNSAAIAVTDNGPGIPQNILTRVFEPFFTTKGNHGSGLGLAVTKKVVAEQGWLLDVYPAEATGMTFRLRIPAAFKEDCEWRENGKQIAQE